MKMSNKEKIILSITLAGWGVISIGSGLTMAASIKPVVHTNYELSIVQRRVSESKTNEIKLKDIELEVNNPLSVDVKDYLEDVDKIDIATLKSLKLDTSLVNTTQVGKYTYTITYNKKKYNGNITIKEHELPNVDLNLKDIIIYVNDSLTVPNETNNYDFSLYIENQLSDDVKRSIILDLSQVNTAVANVYEYTVIYKNTIYKGKVYVKERIITPNTVKPEESKSPEPSLDISPSPTTPTEETPEPTE